jgi:hypothetical protein
MIKLEAGKWYVWVSCQSCAKMIAIDNAPSPNETMGFVSVAWTEIEVHCEACGSESEYQAREVTILQAVALQ